MTEVKHVRFAPLPKKDADRVLQYPKESRPKGEDAIKTEENITRNEDDGSSVSSTEWEDEFQESDHGRERREQRETAIVDLELAKRKGKKRRGLHGRIIYEYQDISFVVDARTGEEVTSWSRSEKIRRVQITPAVQESHDKALQLIKKSPANWRSTTVVVVDTSGSMRRGDISGARNRLESLWMTLAVDNIAHRIESGGATELDVVSIVLMNENSKVLLKEQPCSWVLYNNIVDIYEAGHITPSGHGPFVPGLEITESLLGQGNGALAVCFLSDGKPSDHCLYSGSRDEWNKVLLKQVGEIAMRFGRKLTFTTVAIGKKCDFSLLRQMVEIARDFSANGEFVVPSMSVVGIGEAMTSIATSLTKTTTEMTDALTTHQRTVREIFREPMSKALVPIAKINPTDFSLYDVESVSRVEYREWKDGRKLKMKKMEVPLQNPCARYVAMCKRPFGEGAERFTFRFYELASDRRTILGSPLVSKETRYVLSGESKNEHQTRGRYINTFCKTQQLVGRLGKEFNEKLSSLSCVDPATPRISVLACSIYKLPDKACGIKKVLVEPMVKADEWRKWNGNNGFVRGSSTDFEASEVRPAIQALRRKSLDVSGTSRGDPNQPLLYFNDNQVAQAFSHFTFWASGRKRLVCDLQGIYDKEATLLRLSDPVIHSFYYGEESNKNKRSWYGPTDNGRKGMALFQSTHECNDLCNLMVKGFRNIDWHDSDPHAAKVASMESRRRK